MQKVLPCLDEGAQKVFGPAIFANCNPPLYAGTFLSVALIRTLEHISMGVSVARRLSHNLIMVATVLVTLNDKIKSISMQSKPM